MSDPDLALLPPEAADEAAAALVAERGWDALADIALREIGGQPEWRRARFLEQLERIAGAEALLPALEQALRDPADARNRNAARDALAALAGCGSANRGPIQRRLAELLRRDTDADVRLLAATVLGETGDLAARPALEAALEDPHVNVAAAAADALGVLGDARATPALASLLRHAEPWLRVAATVALGKLRDPATLPALTLAAGDPLTAEAAAEALGGTGDVRALAALRPLLTGPARATAELAVARILCARPDAEPPRWLKELLRDNERELANRFLDGEELYARLLGVVASQAAVDALLTSLADPDFRPAALAGLARVPADTRLELLLQRLEGAADDAAPALLAALPPLRTVEQVEFVVGRLDRQRPESVREATEALARTPAGLALPALTQSLEVPRLRAGAVAALARFGEADPALFLSLLEDPDAAVRAPAAAGLARRTGGDVAVAERVRERLVVERDVTTRHELLLALGAAGGAGAVDDLIPFTLQEQELAIRFAAIRGLGRTASTAAVAPLVDLLASPLDGVHAAALQALGELGEATATVPIADTLENTRRDLRRGAAYALLKIGSPAARKRLVGALADPDHEVRLTAIRTLARIGTGDALPEIRRLGSEDPDALVRQAATDLVRVVDAAE